MSITTATSITVIPSCFFIVLFKLIVPFSALEVGELTNRLQLKGAQDSKEDFQPNLRIWDKQDIQDLHQTAG